MAVKTPGARNFQRQMDDRFPDRAGPDGWIGNEAHKLHTSGHNADDTPGSRPSWDGDPDTVAEVRALDVKNAFGERGVTGLTLVDHLRRLPGIAMVHRYYIHKGGMYHVRDGYARTDFDGDPHDGHVHIEFQWTQAADNNTTFDYRLEEIGMAEMDLTAGAVQKIVNKIGEDTNVLANDESTVARGMRRQADRAVTQPILAALEAMPPVQVDAAAVAAQLVPAVLDALGRTVQDAVRVVLRDGVDVAG